MIFPLNFFLSNKSFCNFQLFQQVLDLLVDILLCKYLLVLFISTIIILLEMFYTLVHGLEGIVDTVDEDISVNVDERIVHPRLIPLLPVCCCDPKVLEWFKLFSQSTHFIILKNNDKKVNDNWKSKVKFSIQKTPH